MQATYPAFGGTEEAEAMDRETAKHRRLLVRALLTASEEPHSNLTEI